MDYPDGPRLTIQPDPVLIRCASDVQYFARALAPLIRFAIDPTDGAILTTRGIAWQLTNLSAGIDEPPFLIVQTWADRFPSSCTCLGFRDDRDCVHIEAMRAIGLIDRDHDREPIVVAACESIDAYLHFDPDAPFGDGGDHD